MPARAESVSALMPSQVKSTVLQMRQVERCADQVCVACVMRQCVCTACEQGERGTRAVLGRGEVGEFGGGADAGVDVGAARQILQVEVAGGRCGVLSACAGSSWSM
jgi:hypothetical protein